MNLSSCLVCIILFFISCICHSGGKENNVVIEEITCGKSICLNIEFINQKKYPICIENSYFPFDGELHKNVFDLVDTRVGNKAKYLQIEPSIIIDSNLAVLVRLVPPGATVSSSIDVKRFYEIDRDKKYKVNYNAVAYRCDTFSKKRNKLKLKGEIDI
ncbi:hypothetical protein [Agarilytica rhodophyticola]|uniref:hypothetical protein n=1 Tax=Agarilytica rhodophyticola TaxID=1737490 RepID=UPI000B346E00|nr:hypothetical protein [Agarilytica rhodophyticola]